MTTVISGSSPSITFSDATTQTTAANITAPYTSTGVVYASSTTALATGSALTFNGTNLSTTGAVGIGDFAASSAVGLNVRFIGNLTSTDIVGISNSISAPATASSSTIGVYSSLRATATSGSRGFLSAFYAEAPSMGATSTASAMRGLYVSNQGNAAISNAYGVYIEAQSGSPTTNQGLRNLGTSRLDGNVGLNTAPATSGTGITFPATDSPSSDVNTLDDYEEGSWTPGLTSSATPISATITSVGRYTKIGNSVVIWGYIYVSAVSSATGSYLRINGLPFSFATSGLEGLTSGSFGPYSSFTGLNASDNLIVGASTSTELNIWITSGNGSFGTGASGANIQATTNFYFSIVGKVA